MHNLRILRAALAVATSSFAYEDATRLSTAIHKLLPRRDSAYRRPYWRATGKRYTPNGKREVARRVAQIAAGRITPANGLA